MKLVRTGMTLALPLVLSLGFFSSMASAQDLDFQEYRKFLMSGDPANKKLAVQTTCTSSDGEVHRIGEVGYDTCLNTIRSAHQQKQMTGGKSESLNTATTGMTIRLGE